MNPKSLTKEATLALREAKEARDIQGIGCFPSSGPTTVYPFDGSGVSVHRDYRIVGGKRFGERTVVVRHHATGGFTVHEGRNGRGEQLAEMTDLRDAVEFAVTLIVNG